ncbi:MAG: glucose-6-phosphate dehydrogenase assembly protein OpcA [Aeriscardovia sp.]|nr:glucose-6-phosphate dehydrogenase assembly protein OpcA [Aeriscardovia sp.]
MEEAVEKEGAAWMPLEEAPSPQPLNSTAVFLALGGRESDAEKVALAFSCAAFSVEEAKEGEGAWGKVRPLPGGGAVVSLKVEKAVPLDHALYPLLPEGASLAVFDPGRVAIKEGLYSMCSCYITDAGSREVLRNFEALTKSGEKVIDLSWERTRQWRERALSLLSGKSPRAFSIEAGRLDAGVLLLAGWIKEEFDLPAKILQAPSFEASISKVCADLEGGEAKIEEEEGKASFKVSEGGREFQVPKIGACTSDLLVRQMGLLPPDPLFKDSLSFEIEGAEDVG